MYFIISQSMFYQCPNLSILCRVANGTVCDCNCHWDEWERTQVLSVNKRGCVLLGLFYCLPICSPCAFESNPFAKPATAKLQRQIVKDGSRIKCKSNQSGWNPSLLKKRSQWGWREKGLENRWSSSRNTKSHPVRSEWLILLYQCAISRLKSQNYCAEARIKGC